MTSKREITRDQYWQYYQVLEALWEKAQFTWSRKDLEEITRVQELIKFYYQFAPNDND